MTYSTTFDTLIGTAASYWQITRANYVVGDEREVQFIRAMAVLEGLRLCLPDSHSREISGLDTRSVAALCALVTEGLATDTRVDIFAEVHSSLRIGPGKAIEVVV